jgi:hypothetical protein
LKNTEAQYGARYTPFQAANICAWLETVRLDYLDALCACLWEIELPWACNLPRIEHYKKAWEKVNTQKMMDAPTSPYDPRRKFLPESTEECLPKDEILKRLQDGLGELKGREIDKILTFRHEGTG